MEPVECQGCKHWNPHNHNEPGLDIGAPWHLPDYAQISEEIPVVWGTCRREHEPNPPMFTEDGSDYFSALRTRRDFSCAAWEAR